jgi:hypothetical protein
MDLKFNIMEELLLGHLETEKFTLSGYYVISVSEFCPNSDLNSY